MTCTISSEAVGRLIVHLNDNAHIADVRPFRGAKNARRDSLLMIARMYIFIETMKVWRSYLDHARIVKVDNDDIDSTLCKAPAVIVSIASKLENCTCHQVIGT